MAYKCPIDEVQVLEDGKAALEELSLGGSKVDASTVEVDLIADTSAFHKKYTATAPAAIPTTVRVIELAHDATPIEKTIASLVPYAGQIVTVKNTSAEGTAAHTVTVTTGTWNGTNKVATLNAPGKCIAVAVDSEGNGVIVENVGTVTFS